MKAKKILLAALLQGGVIVLILLYSPIGSPYNYRKSSVVLYPGVKFGSKIGNAPKGNNHSQSENADISIPEINVDSLNVELLQKQPIIASVTRSRAETLQAANYAVSSTNAALAVPAVAGQQAIFLSGTATSNRSAASASIKDANLSVGVGDHGSNRMLVRSESVDTTLADSKPNDRYAVQQKPNKLLFPDSKQTASSILSANAGPQKIGIDPGEGDDELDPPISIPVSDDWGFLLLLAAIYSLREFRLNRNSKFTV